MKHPVTLSLDHEQYGKFKRVCASLGVSVSSKVDELIRQALAEVTGEKEDAVSPVDYEALKNQHSRLVGEVDKLEKRLKKLRVYDELYDFSEKIGLDLGTLSNLSDLMADMLKKWDGVRGDMHEWITFLETAKEKRKVIAKLEEIRTALAKGKPADFEADAFHQNVITRPNQKEKGVKQKDRKKTITEAENARQQTPS